MIIYIIWLKSYLKSLGGSNCYLDQHLTSLIPYLPVFCLILGLLAKILRNFVERSVISFSRPHQTNKFLVPTFIVGLTKAPLWIYHCFSTVSIYKCGGTMLIRCTNPDSTFPRGWALCFNCNERLHQ